MRWVEVCLEFLFGLYVLYFTVWLTIPCFCDFVFLDELFDGVQ
jgi:hypothetical protein